MKKIIMISGLMFACIAEANCFDQPKYDLQYNLEHGRLIFDMGNVKQNPQQKQTPTYNIDNERLIFDTNQDISNNYRGKKN